METRGSRTSAATEKCAVCKEQGGTQPLQAFGDVSFCLTRSAALRHRHRHNLQLRCLSLNRAHRIQHGIMLCRCVALVTSDSAHCTDYAIKAVRGHRSKDQISMMHSSCLVNLNDVDARLTLETARALHKNQRPLRRHTWQTFCQGESTSQSRKEQ